LARRGAWTLFHGVLTFGAKVIEFQSFFMNWKIELYYLLFWKIHNFHIACPNAMKQRPLHTFVHKTFYSYQESRVIARKGGSISCHN